MKDSKDDWRDEFALREFLSLEEAACIGAEISPAANEGILRVGPWGRDGCRAHAFAAALKDAARLGKIHVGEEQDAEGNFLFLYHPHIRAWAKQKGIDWPVPGECFGPGEEEPAPAPADEVPPAPAPEAGKAPARAKRETQAGRIEGLLQEIERRASEKGVPFDRQAMPGTKADLLALAHAWDPALRTLRVTESLSEHTRGLCKWKAGRRRSALAFFATLFPDAPLCRSGAVLPLRKTA